jgi:hypothetical protein
MRLLAIRQTFEECPPEISAIGVFPDSVTHVTKGKIYEAYAIAVWSGVPVFQVIDDLGSVTWLAGWLFKIESNDIPEDWVINCFEGKVSLVMGPSFVAENEAAYDAMIDEEVEAKTKFWQRVRVKSAKREMS